MCVCVCVCVCVCREGRVYNGGCQPYSIAILSGFFNCRHFSAFDDLGYLGLLNAAVSEVSDVTHNVAIPLKRNTHARTHIHTHARTHPPTPHTRARTQARTQPTIQARTHAHKYILYEIMISYCGKTEGRERGRVWRCAEQMWRET